MRKFFFVLAIIAGLVGLAAFNRNRAISAEEALWAEAKNKAS